MFSLFEDSREYKKRLATPFKPTNVGTKYPSHRRHLTPSQIQVTLKDIHSAIPKHLYEKSTLKALFYIARDVFCAVIVYKLGWRIDPFSNWVFRTVTTSLLANNALKWSLWALYWHWQGVILAGWWCMAHEAGHGTLSPYSWFNHLIGYTLHTFILVPYYAWRSSHHAHHKATMSVELDENYVPRTRSEYNLPKIEIVKINDYHEIFEEAPIYTLLRMLIMQTVGWQFYLFTNAMGNQKYSAGANVSLSYAFIRHERAFTTSM